MLLGQRWSGRVTLKNSSEEEEKNPRVELKACQRHGADVPPTTHISRAQFPFKVCFENVVWSRRWESDAGSKNWTPALCEAHLLTE